VIGLTCMPTKPEPLNLGVPVVNFPRANAILARAQALLWVRDCIKSVSLESEGSSAQLRDSREMDLLQVYTALICYLERLLK
jgi:hypothetical protein